MTLGGLVISSPWALVSLPIAIAGLVYAYKRRGRGTKILVSSVMLMRRLKKTNQSRRVFEPPPRFYLEVLMLTLLGAGVAGIWLARNATNDIVVIDNSVSMSGINSAGMTVLDSARNEVAAYLATKSFGDTVKLFATCESANNSNRTLGYKVEEVKSSYCSDRLESVVADVLNKNSSFDELHIYSDKLAATTPLPRITLHQIRTEPFDNVAVSDLKIENASITESKLNTKVTVKLVSYSRKEMQGVLSLSAMDPALGDTAVEVSRREFALQPGEEQHVVIPAMLKSGMGVLAHIEEKPSGAIHNAVHLDDDRYGVVGAAHSGTLVVSDSPKTLGFDLINSDAFEYKAAAAYALSDSAHFKTTIFHRFYPGELPANNVLLILPPNGSGFYQQINNSMAAVTRFEPLHPITAYVNLNVVNLQGTITLKTPQWALPLIESTVGTLAFAGEANNRKIAVFGFELLPFEGKKAPTTGILLLNTLKWLSEGNISGNYTEVGQTVVLDTNVKRVTSVKNEEISTTKNSNSDFVTNFEQPGLYIETLGNGERRLRAVNFFSAEESNLLLNNPVNLVVPEKDSDDNYDSAQQRSALIGLLVLLLLAIDLIFNAYRVRKVMRI